MENLRFDAGFDSDLMWDNENGMRGMVETCHGCGDCRTQQTEGGVICPTYRAADEEIQVTRGRLNVLRQAMSGDLPDDPTDDEFVTEVMDLCIGCKGCANDCPIEVDTAKLKAEVTHAHHEAHSLSFRSKLFANVDTLAKVGSASALVSNWVAKVPGARTVLERETLQDSRRFPRHGRRGGPTRGSASRHLHEIQPSRRCEDRGQDHRGRRTGYRVDPLDLGWCGMIGSFGYEAEHRAMSQAIGDTLKCQVDDSEAESVVAPGASCRTQLNGLGRVDRSLLPDKDADREEPPTPSETLAAALTE
jgi:Fe-S oxidoreductase